ncbi:MAG: NAD-dependent succinate-semialdehyde dehydrogenase [Alphaproteobacteria bacterium]|nr:NAD-dependent succinate-semialdehyde dehydrogenase [Alphaproteobacteria bacterium]
MYPKNQLFIAGRWRDGGAGETLPVLNPATEDEIGRLAVATEADLDEALAAASSGFETWRKVPAVERAARLHRAGAILRERVEEIARVLTLELGAPIAAARMEVMIAADVLDWSAGEARRVYGRLIPSRFPGVRQLAVREPVGVVFAASPWNMPVIFPSRKIAEALAAGCAIIIKPAEDTPGCATLVVRALEDAGIPPGVVNLVTGDPGFISRHLLASPSVRKLSFTGSVPVGKHLAALAAARMIRCTMELGGHAPTIVMDDAPVEPVARMLAERKARNSGQVCNSPTRFFVQSGIYERFRKSFAEALREVRIGDPLDAATQMGPLVNRRRMRAVEELVEDARRQGARLAGGGGRIGNRGFFHDLTLLDEVPDTARIMREEPFGPVAALQPFDRLDEVIERANRLPFGLAAYAFSTSRHSLDELAERLEVGLLGLNHCNIAAAETPFGGVKESGYGSEGGSEGIEGYLVTKFVTEAPPPA